MPVHFVCYLRCFQFMLFIGTVFTELEEEANTPLAKTLQLSEPEVRYCVHMIEKYGEDYKVKTIDISWSQSS